MMRKGRKVTEKKGESFFYVMRKINLFPFGLIIFNYTYVRKICKILWRNISDLFTRADVYSEPSQISKMELFCKNSSRMRPSYIRSIRPEVFCKTGVLRNFAKFTGKHLCQSLF